MVTRGLQHSRSGEATLGANPPREAAYEERRRAQETSASRDETDSRLVAPVCRWFCIIFTLLNEDA